MPSQKLENLLNLALQASAQERENSQVLSVGFTPSTRTWELIVKYHGSLEQLQSDLIQIEPLILGYAIVTIREDLIESFASLDEVEFIEIPKSLYFQNPQP